MLTHAGHTGSVRGYLATLGGELGRDGGNMAQMARNDTMRGLGDQRLFQAEGLPAEPGLVAASRPFGWWPEPR